MKDNLGVSPLDLAAQADSLEVAQLLVALLIPNGWMASSQPCQQATTPGWMDGYMYIYIYRERERG